MKSNLLKKIISIVLNSIFLFQVIGMTYAIGAGADEGMKYSYVYDQTGKLDTAILPSGRVIDYQYDSNGNLTRKVAFPLTNSAPPLVTLTSPTGLVTSPTVSSLVRPLISWTQIDDANHFEAYNVKVYPANSSIAIVDYYGLKSNGVWTLNKDLQFGQKYLIEVRVTDGEKWSNKVSGWLQIQNTITEYSGESLSFDGTKQLEFTNVAVNTENGGKNTVDFWMNWDGSDYVMPFGWNGAYDLWFNNGYFGFNTGNADILGISSAELKNRWVHVAAVFSNGVPNSSNVEIYINGVKQTISQKQGLTTTSVAATSTVYISGWGPTKGNYLFRGKMANVHIWNRALTATEIQGDMYRVLTGNELGLVGNWKLADPTPLTSLNFDGTKQLEFTNVAVNTANGGKNTVDFWMNWDGSENVMPIGWNGAYDLWFNNGYFGFNTANADILGISSAELKNKWVHVAAVFSNGVPNASNVELYINGVKQTISQKQGVTTIGVTATPTVYVSGFGLSKGNYLFRGKVADVHIWNRALTATEIQGDMYRVLTGNELGLVGYWKLSDPTLTSLSFDGSKQLEFTNVAVNTTSGGKNTVEFWMNWDGSENVMPFGWNGAYDLWFNNGYFGLNTGNADLLGISSTELKNKWVHVAVVFSNGVPDPKNVELYINGVKQAISQKQGLTTNSVVATPTVYISGWGLTKGNYMFRGKMADVHVWNRALTVTEIQGDMYRVLTGNELGLVGNWRLQ